MEEIWKIVDRSRAYEVSSTGKVRSIDRIVKCSDGRLLPKRGKILKQWLSTAGYPVVSLDIVYAKKHGPIPVHRLVAEAFLPNREGLRCVNHKDLNKLNNSVKNLEWVSHSGNAIHARDNGRLIHLEQVWAKNVGRSRLAMLTAAEVREIVPQKGKVSSYVLAKEYRVSASSIQRIWNGRTWRSIT